MNVECTDCTNNLCDMCVYNKELEEKYKMTAEETAIHVLENRIETYEICGGDNYNPAINLTKEDYEAFKLAVEVLHERAERIKIKRLLCKEKYIEPYQAFNTELLDTMPGVMSTPESYIKITDEACKEVEDDK